MAKVAITANWPEGVEREAAHVLAAERLLERGLLLGGHAPLLERGDRDPVVVPGAIREEQLRCFLGPLGTCPTSHRLPPPRDDRCDERLRDLASALPTTTAPHPRLFR